MTGSAGSLSPDKTDSAAPFTRIGMPPELADEYSAPAERRVARHELLPDDLPQRARPGPPFGLTAPRSPRSNGTHGQSTWPKRSHEAPVGFDGGGLAGQNPGKTRRRSSSVIVPPVSFTVAGVCCGASNRGPQTTPKRRPGVLDIIENAQVGAGAPSGT
jgi:hypothetical protein